MKKLKLFILAALVTALAAASLSGCKKSDGKKGVTTLIPGEDISSMAVDGQGKLYILTDEGLKSYALAGDRRLELEFDSDDIAQAEFKWNDSGDMVVFSSFKPERVIANGDTGLQFLGRYIANDGGREADLFVIQDIADMNYSAAYFSEIQREYGAKTPTVNGVGVTKSGIYFKLNRPNVDRPNYDKGANIWFDGHLTSYDVPDGVVGAIGKTEDLKEEVWFLTKDGDGYAVTDGAKNVLKKYDGEKAAGAFSDTESFYIIYKTGKVVRWTPEDGEKSFADLGVKLDEVRDPFVWDGQIYWLDGEGVKTAAK